MHRRYVDPHGYLLKREVVAFAGELGPGMRLLDAGAGECQYKPLFAHCRYTGVDLAVGDESWDYSKLDLRCDLTNIPRPDGSFDACLCAVVLEHVPDPVAICRELARVLTPGAPILVAVPFVCQQHQMPHDFFRYSSNGIRQVLEAAGFQDVAVTPWGHDRLTVATCLGAYYLLPGKGLVSRATNKLLSLGWTALKAYHLHHPQPSPEIPFGWFARARR